MKFNACNAFHLALLSSALLAPSARAADGTWVGAGGDTLWSNPGNWSGGVVATGSDATADFGTLDLSGDITVNLNAPRTLGNLTFSDTDPTTAGGWTLANNGSSSNILTLSGTTTPVIAVNSLGTGKFATISATLAGAGFTKTGAGTLVLAGANSSYTGGIALNQGTLVGTVAGAFGSSASTVAFGGGNLELRGDSNTTFTAAANLVTSGGTITINRATSAAIATTHTLGPVAIGSQQLSVTAGGNITSETPYGLTLGATTLSGDAVFDVSNNGAGTGTLTLGSINTGGAVRTITKQGAGTLKLGAASGAVAAGTQFLVNNGVLVAAANGAFSNTANTANTTTIMVNAGGELQGTAAGAFKSSGTGELSEAITLSDGTLRLVAYHPSYTYFYGNLTYNSGDLIVNGTATNKPRSNSMGKLSIGSSTLAPIAVDIATPTLNFAETTLTGNPVFDTSQVNISVGALDDGGTARVITKQGTGDLNLGASAASMAAGSQLLITGGTVIQGSSNALGTNLPTLVVAPNSGTATFRLQGLYPAQSFGAVTLGGDSGTSAVLSDDGSGSIGILNLEGPLKLDATLNPSTSSITCKLGVGTSSKTFNVEDSSAVADDLVVSGVITNGAGGSILKTGSGTMVLSSINSSYTGGFALNEGLLVGQGVPGDGNFSALGTSASIVTFGGGTLEIRGRRVLAGLNMVGSGGTITINPYVPGSGTSLGTGGLTIGSRQLSLAPGNMTTINTPYQLSVDGTTVVGDAVFDIANNGSGIGTFRPGALNTDGSARIITKQGAGTMQLSSVGNISAGTEIRVNSGKLAVTLQGALSSIATTPNTTTVVVGPMGELEGASGGAFESSGTGAPSQAITLAGGTLRLSTNSNDSGTFGGNFTYNGGSIILDRTTSGTAGTLSMESLSIGSLTLAPTSANYTTLPTLSFKGATITGDAVFDTTHANITLGRNVYGDTGLSDDGTGHVITKQGSNTLVLGNAGNLSSGTQVVINEGTLSQLGSFALGTNNPTLSIIPPSGTGIYELAGNEQAVGVVTLGGAIGTTSSISTAGFMGLRLTGGLTYDATANPNGATISGIGVLRIDTAQTFTVGDSNAAVNDLTISARVTGNGALVKAGPGALLLSGANSYVSGTTVNAGTVVVAVSDTGTGAGGLAGSSRSVKLGDITGSSNASILIGGAFTVGNNITVQSGSTGNTLTLGVNAAATATISGNVTLGTSGTNPSKDLSLVAASGGSVTFSGIFNENTNNTTVAHLTVGDGTNNGTVKLSNTANAYGGSTSINGGTLEVIKLAAGGSNSSIGNSGTSAGAGSVATDLILNGGTLRYIGTTGTGSTNRLFTIGSNGATLDASSADNTALTFTGTGSLVAAGSGDRTLTLTGTTSAAAANSLASVIANPSSGTTSVIKSGSNTWTLSGANTYTGTTTISSGTLRLVGAAATILTDGDTATTSDIIINGGSLVVGASEQIANSGSIYMTSGSFGFGDASGLTETIDKLTNLGGTFSTGANTIISTGSTVTWADGTNTINAGGAVVDHHWVISGGTNTVSAGVIGGTMQVDTAGTAPTGLEFSGTGTPVITLVAAGAGETAGRILLRNDVSVADTLTGSAQIVSTSQTNPGIVNLDGGTRTFTVNNAAPATDLLISASVQNGGLTKTGAGTLELTGINTYTGVTTVSGGVLSVGVIENGGAAGNLGQAGSEPANLVLAGGTLQYTGATASTDRGMTFNNVAGNTLDVSVGGTVLTISGTLTGSGGLAKSGSGTLALTGSNDYANGTTVSAGKLVVTNAATTSGTGGTGSGSVTVAAGATLAGTGRIAGATSLSNAVGETRATHAVGDGTSGSTGVQYFGSGLTYGSGSIFEWDLRANSTAGSFDQVNVNGALSVDSSTIFRIVLGGAVDLTDSFWSTPYITQTWNDIFTSSSLIGGFDTSNIQVAGLEITGKGSFSVSGTSLTWTAVPELSNLLAGALLGAGLLRRRRKGCCG